MDQADKAASRARKLLDGALLRLPTTHPLYRPARLLRALWDNDQAKATACTLGTTTPTGRPTFEALCRARLGAGKPDDEGGKRGSREVSLEKDDVQRGLVLYAPQILPPGPIIIDHDPALDPGSMAPEAWISRDAFTHHTLKHPTLNPVQALVLPYVEKGLNIVVAAATSVGKTVIAEMMMADALKRKAKAIFLSPLRAVSQEKYDEWTDEDHPWAEKGVEIVTGDYSLTDARKAALRRARVIVMTSEMLDSKTRRMYSEKNDWLLRVLTLVIDEAHLLTMEERGDALECGIMRFTKQNPEARLVLLSATMPNVDELAAWLTKCNGRPSVVVRSPWRPTKLTTHWVPYPDHGTYSANEESKRDTTMRILFAHPRDKFLVFVHSKKAGHDLLEELHEHGEKPQFHSADLNREQRLKLEGNFREGDLRVVIATSTLAYGVNMPARRVIVHGIHRGMDEVDPIDVQQEIGRAGRFGIDPEGDAYILIPASRAASVKHRFSQVGPIESKLNDVDTLAFHLTAEVAEQGVSTEPGAVAWHERSFAAFRGEPLEEKVTLPPPGTPERMQALANTPARKLDLNAAAIMEKLAKVGILKKDEDGHYTATMLGKVSSWLYYSPFDIADWATNFRKLVEMDKLRDDTCLAWALGCVKTSFKKPWLPRDVEHDLHELGQRLRTRGIEFQRLPGAVLVYECMLKGWECKPLISDQRKFVSDSERLMQAVDMIDRYVLKGLGSGYTDLLQVRLKYGVGWREADLCKLPGIGAKRAHALVAAGIISVADVLAKQNTIASIVGKRIAEHAIRGAKGLMRDSGGKRRRGTED